MPSNQHLVWAEITDFTPGLFTRGQFTMPPNAAQQMDNCYPQPGGGLRAFFRDSALTTTGITNKSQKHAAGVGAHGNMPLRVGIGSASDFYLVTRRESVSLEYNLYRMDGTNGEVAWTSIRTAVGTGAGGHAAYMQPFMVTDTSRYMLIPIYFLGAADEGLYAVKYSDGVQTQINVTAESTDLAGPVVHQNRFMAIGIKPVVGGGWGQSSLYYSDPGAITVPAANFVNPEPERDFGQIAFMLSYSPSDLIVAKQGGDLIVIQGDITDPTVRYMGNQLRGIPRQQVAYTPGGVAFYVSDDGVYLTDNGATVNRLSDQLDMSADDTLDAMTRANLGMVSWQGFLFGPFGYVYDFSTEAWFRVTAFSNVADMFLDRGTPQLIGYTQGLDFTLPTIDLREGATRESTWTWKSAPLRAGDGRDVEIREVQAYVETHDANAQVSCTVGGSTDTITVATAGIHQLSFLFVARGEVLDVTITSTAGAGANEAPKLEMLRIGHGRGHLLSHG